MPSFFHYKPSLCRAFTLIEFLIVLFIFALLLVLVITGFGFFEQQTQLDEQAQAVIQVLRLAQSQTVGSRDNQQYGVYFENSQATLFKGAIYLAADPNNQVFVLTQGVEISEINLSPATSTNAVLFERMSGASDNYGFVRLRLVSEPTNSRLIYIEPTGQVSLSTTPAATDGRQTDSRHIHIGFSRNIDTTNEKIFLTFDGAANPQQTIDIATNLSGGQVDWSGTVNIGGENQIIHLHTHYLNDAALNTLFCLHRDRRQNTKALKVDVGLNYGSADNLVNYSADGFLTNGTSIWANAPEIQ